MTIRVVSALALSVAVLPAVASASEFSAATTLGYASSDLEGYDVDSTTLDATFDARATDALSFGLDLSLARVNPEESEDFSVPSFMATMNYAIGDGFSVGAYAERFTLDEGFLTFLDVDFDSYGVTAGYSSGTYKVQAFYGATTSDPEIDGLEIRDFGLLAAAAPNEQTTLSARYLRSTLEAGGDKDDWESFEVAGTYQVNEPWALFGGASFGNIDALALEMHTVGLGVSYNLGAVSSVPATLSLELARTNFDFDGPDADMDSVRFGVTLPLGDAGAKLPLNSVAGSIQNGRHSALSSATLAAF